MGGSRNLNKIFQIYRFFSPVGGESKEREGKAFCDTCLAIPPSTGCLRRLEIQSEKISHDLPDILWLVGMVINLFGAEFDVVELKHFI